MNANFGLLDELETPVRDKRRKRELLAERALRSLDEWITANDVLPAADSRATAPFRRAR